MLLARMQGVQITNISVMHPDVGADVVAASWIRG
jgi:hypothetical protein